ncbi:hypothetical protein E_018 [Cronobacter phage vB_CsaM_leE]|uniref:Uncharacterized protein n=2 Tax=Pseudotevenvirus TaxID=2842979 RepID=A0A1W5N0W4_9CAUD|nr:hypothetical protein HWB01_gp018 [Cronobacter phage vB_CsaM_leE]AOG16424.1 hypothetical protein N_018 [Cronobacter phage vB_CsaM_leN]AON97027.1 hypothetical protein E_018 [Cronobacter phage vB_CsaM_leE]
MRIVIGGCGIGRALTQGLIDSIRWIQPSVELYSLPNRIEYSDPTPYKMKPYQAPRVNRALHRQSVNRGK